MIQQSQVSYRGASRPDWKDGGVRVAVIIGGIIVSGLIVMPLGWLMGFVLWLLLFISPHFPDKKYLKCPACGTRNWAAELTKKA